MNICLFTKTTLAHGLGGVEVHVDTLSRTIPAMGNKLTILATRHPEGIEREERPGCVIHYLEKTRPARYNAAFFRAARQKFLELHQNEPFDILWAEDFAAYGCLDVPDRPPLISIMQGSGLRGLIRSEWNRLDSPRETLRFMFKFLPEAIIFYSFWYGRVLRKSDAVAPVSRETGEEYSREHGVARDRIHVVFNSVDADRFSPNPDLRKRLRDQQNLNDDHFVILMAAVVHKQKGMHIGMEAFHGIAGRFPKARLWVAGGGPHLNELKDLAAKLGISERVAFFGPVNNDDMPTYYNAADVYLNPTLRFEGLPITTVEAMACGKPIVISRIGGTPSTIDEGVSGFFVPPGHSGPIQERLSRLMENPHTQMQMGIEARQRAFVHFNRNKMAQDLLSVSESLLRQKRHD